MIETFESHLPRQFYGYERSDVKLLVVSDLLVMNYKFADIAAYLSAGDLLIFNNSKLIPSSLDVYSEEFQRFAKINIGTDRQGNRFLLEVRPKEFGTDVQRETTFSITGTGHKIKLLKKHEKFSRFWWGELDDETVSIDSVLREIGKYVRYDHIPFDIPKELFDGVFYKFPGSVELPSASYPFDLKILNELERNGVKIEEITLHCNLGSLEYSEFRSLKGLLPEKFVVPVKTIRAIHDTRKRGNKVVAVGTTVVRVLESLYLNTIRLTELSGESVTDSNPAMEGTTDIFIDRSHDLKMVDGIITGMHESDGSHIRMLEAFQTRNKIAEAYKKAEEWGFQYHEFGDLALIFRQSS